MNITTTEYFIYLVIPKEYYTIYVRLLEKLTDCGIDILKDCNTQCNDVNKQVFKCWNLFQSACAAYQLGDDCNIKLANLFIKYIKAQLNITGELEIPGDQEEPEYIEPKIILTNNKTVVDYTGGDFVINYTTEGNIGTIQANDNSNDLFTYVYSENAIHVTAKAYSPVEEKSFIITISGSNGGSAEFTVIRTPKPITPEIKLNQTSIIRDWEGLDSDGNEAGVDFEIIGDVGDITYEVSNDWIQHPGTYVEGENYIPIILSINDSSDDRIGHININISKGYSAELEILQEGKPISYDIYYGTRDYSISNVAMQPTEVTSGTKLNITSIPYNLSSDVTAKCKWWAVPSELKVYSIVDDLGGENISNAAKANVTVNEVSYAIYSLYSPLVSSTKYTVKIKKN